MTCYPPCSSTLIFSQSPCHPPLLLSSLSITDANPLPLSGSRTCPRPSSPSLLLLHPSTPPSLQSHLLRPTHDPRSSTSLPLLLRQVHLRNTPSTSPTDLRSSFRGMRGKAGRERLDLRGSDVLALASDSTWRASKERRRRLSWYESLPEDFVCFLF